MRREKSIQILWLIAILCSIAIFVGIWIIGSFMREMGWPVRTLGDLVGTLIMLPIVALFGGGEPAQQEALWILLVACLVPVFMVGALSSVILALWATFRSPEKN